MRSLVELLSLTRGIVKEMRSLTTTPERIKQFRKNVEKLCKKIRDYCPAECTKVPYLHALHDDVAESHHGALAPSTWLGLRVFFWCMVSEHLIKLLKEIEHETDFPLS